MFQLFLDIGNTLNSLFYLSPRVWPGEPSFHVLPLSATRWQSASTTTEHYNYVCMHVCVHVSACVCVCARARSVVHFLSTQKYSLTDEHVLVPDLIFLATVCCCAD